jgi:hypothetical protein
LREHPELYETWVWREFGDNPIGTSPYELKNFTG